MSDIVTLITGGRLVDPASGTDKIADILIEGQTITKIGSIDAAKLKGAKVIDAKGLVVTPGFIDLHTHTREPGREDEETLESVVGSANAGGFTSVTAMPNTDPVIDNSSVVNFVQRKAKGLSADIFVSGAMTGNIKGEHIAEMASMAAAGAVFFTDDGGCVQSSALMRRIMQYAKGIDRKVFLHCEDTSLTKNAQINEGGLSTSLGFKGWPKIAESMIVSRDIQLAADTGCGTHFTHISCAESVELIRNAKQQGLPVTCDVTPHHIGLNDSELSDYNAICKVNPPLSSEQDRLALIEGLLDGTIDAIATDHAPHAVQEKECEFEYAAFGTIGLESAFAATVTALEPGKQDVSTIVAKFTTGPAKVLGISASLAEGNMANIALIDMEKKWIFSDKDIYSKSKNSAFIRKELRGQVFATFYKGEQVFQRETDE